MNEWMDGLKKNWHQCFSVVMQIGSYKPTDHREQSACRSVKLVKPCHVTRYRAVDS